MQEEDKTTCKKLHYLCATKMYFPDPKKSSNITNDRVFFFH